MILATSLPSLCWEFATRHPGLMLVLIGVAGEVACDWKEMTGRLALAKKVSAMLLVIGLAIEFWESAKLDNEVANTAERTAIAVKEASQANARAAKFDADRVLIEKQAEDIRGTNFVLQAKLLEMQLRFSFRQISHQKQQDLSACLKNAPKGKVLICTGFIDLEAIQYGNQISNVLATAGFVVRPYQDNYNITSIGIPGLSMICRDYSHVPLWMGSLKNCFDQNGLPIACKDPTGFMIDSNEVVVVVGPRF